MKLFLTAMLLFIAVPSKTRAQTMLPASPAGDYPAHMFSEDFYKHEDKDQGLTIVWKLLKQYRAPHLPRAAQIHMRQQRGKWPTR